MCHAVDCKIVCYYFWKLAIAARKSVTIKSNYLAGIANVRWCCSNPLFNQNTLALWMHVCCECRAKRQQRGRQSFCQEEKTHLISFEIHGTSLEKHFDISRTGAVHMGMCAIVVSPKMLTTMTATPPTPNLARIMKYERRKKRKEEHDMTYLLPKFAFQKSAASALVIRNWSPANTPFGKIAFSSLNMCENTRLSFVKFRR